MKLYDGLSPNLPHHVAQGSLARVLGLRYRGLCSWQWSLPESFRSSEDRDAYQEDSQDLFCYSPIFYED